MNTIELTGRCCKDPAVFDTAKGKMIRVRLAEHFFQSDKGVKEEKTMFLDAKVFPSQYNDELAKIQKGDSVKVVGRLIQEEFEKDGEKRQSLVILCDYMEKVAKKDKPPAEEKEHKF